MRRERERPLMHIQDAPWGLKMIVEIGLTDEGMVLLDHDPLNDPAGSLSDDHGASTAVGLVAACEAVCGKIMLLKQYSDKRRRSRAA